MADKGKNTAYKVLYDHAVQLTGNKCRSRKIVDYVILEGARILVETEDQDKAQRFMVSKLSILCYDHTRHREARLRPYKRLWCALHYFGNLSHWRGTEKLTTWQWIYERRFSWNTAWKLAKTIHP